MLLTTYPSLSLYHLLLAFSSSFLPSVCCPPPPAPFATSPPYRPLALYCRRITASCRFSSGGWTRASYASRKDAEGRAARSSRSYGNDDGESDSSLSLFFSLYLFLFLNRRKYREERSFRPQVVARSLRVATHEGTARGRAGELYKKLLVTISISFVLSPAEESASLEILFRSILWKPSI